MTLLSAVLLLAASVWQKQADGTITGMTQSAAVGEFPYVRVFRWKQPTRELIFDFRGAHVSFASAPSRAAGSGLIVQVTSGGESACFVSALRITGEDWAELGAAKYVVRFEQPVTQAQVVFRLVDIDRRDALRADLQAFSLEPATTSVQARECPSRR